MVALLWPDFLAFLAFVTPVVPSEVPFLLAAAACRSRSAARLEAARMALVSFGLAAMVLSSRIWRPGVGAVEPVLRNPVDLGPCTALAAAASRALLASRSSTAALSERSRILAAPRLETSSIFSSVYTSALSARISAT